MLTELQRRQLIALRPALHNIIGFYSLLDHDRPKTPFQMMEYQIHLNAAAVKVAQTLHTIIEDLDTQEPDI